MYRAFMNIACSLFTNLVPLKNPCDDCHINAVCINHRCFCREGFVGNGYNCDRGKLI